MRDSRKEETGLERLSGREEFTATHWSRVALAAGQDGSEEAREALEALCRRYWPSIYSFLRRNNHSPANAEDLTQGFFGHLLQQNSLSRADPNRGRFRNFLLGALRRYLADEGRRAAAQKRGRDRLVLALDFQTAEDRYLEEADPGLTPEQLYDRQWSETVLENAFDLLEAEFREAGQSDRFDRLKRFLSENAEEGDYEREGALLGIGTKAVSSAVSRLRGRYRELVRASVLATVAGAEDFQRELQDLFR